MVVATRAFVRGKSGAIPFGSLRSGLAFVGPHLLIGCFSRVEGEGGMIMLMFFCAVISSFLIKLLTDLILPDVNPCTGVPMK